MSNKFQDKEEYVKPHSVSLKPSEYADFCEHAKKHGLSFSKMVKGFFYEDMEKLENCVTEEKKRKREKRIENMKLLLKNAY